MDETLARAPPAGTRKKKSGRILNFTRPDLSMSIDNGSLILIKGPPVARRPFFVPASRRVHKDCFTEASLNHEPVLAGNNWVKSRNPLGKLRASRGI